MGIAVLGEMPKAQDDWIYPCNVKTMRLFIAMSTQWRTGMSGATGLDYTPLQTVAKSIGVRLSAKRMTDLQTMERAALAYWQEQRAKNGG